MQLGRGQGELTGGEKPGSGNEEQGAPDGVGNRSASHLG